MINKIDHIGIAVKSLEEGIALYRDVMGLTLHAVEEVPEQKVRVAMFEVGDVHIELLEPSAEDSPIARFLEKHGPGMHHICYDVENVDDMIEEMSSKGIRMIDTVSRPGAGGKRVAFVHPKSTMSVLTELNADKK